jgi:molybdopterin synthase catalytic subunit
MKRCHCCRERFGLIRHRLGHLQFCSAICLVVHRAALRQAALAGLSAATPDRAAPIASPPALGPPLPPASG